MATNRVHEPEAFARTRIALSIYDDFDRAIDRIALSATDEEYTEAFAKMEQAREAVRVAFVADARNALDPRSVDTIECWTPSAFIYHLDFARKTANYALATETK